MRVESFIDQLADGMMKDVDLDSIKQTVYDACALDAKNILTFVNSMEVCVGDLDKEIHLW